jgi:hypothetical protein
VFTVHGSHANASARRRAGFVLRIMPTTSFLNRNRPDIEAKNRAMDWRSRPVYLLRGVDRCGGNALIDC